MVEGESVANVPPFWLVVGANEHGWPILRPRRDEPLRLSSLHTAATGIVLRPEAPVQRLQVDLSASPFAEVRVVVPERGVSVVLGADGGSSPPLVAFYGQGNERANVTLAPGAQFDEVLRLHAEDMTLDVSQLPNSVKVGLDLVNSAVSPAFVTVIKPKGVCAVFGSGSASDSLGAVVIDAGEDVILRLDRPVSVLKLRREVSVRMDATGASARDQPRSAVDRVMFEPDSSLRLGPTQLVVRMMEPAESDTTAENVRLTVGHPEEPSTGRLLIGRQGHAEQLHLENVPVTVQDNASLVGITGSVRLEIGRSAYVEGEESQGVRLESIGPITTTGPAPAAPMPVFSLLNFSIKPHDANLSLLTSLETAHRLSPMAPTLDKTQIATMSRADAAREAVFYETLAELAQNRHGSGERLAELTYWAYELRRVSTGDRLEQFMLGIMRWLGHGQRPMPPFVALVAFAFVGTIVQQTATRGCCALTDPGAVAAWFGAFFITLLAPIGLLRVLQDWFPTGTPGAVYAVILALGSVVFGVLLLAIRRRVRIRR